MAKLTPPTWCPDAIPTIRGWVKPNLPGKEGNPELIKAMRISLADIDAFNGNEAMNEQKENDLLVLTEAPVGNKPLDEMTEEQLEALKETTGSNGDTLTE